MAYLPRFIGLRYTRSKRSNQFLSFVSGFSFFGMMLGVMALIIVLSVMNGFDRELKGRILSVVPHGFIKTAKPEADWQSLADQAMANAHTVAAAPYISGFGLLSRRGVNQGVEVQAILPEKEAAVSVIDQHMLIGQLGQLKAGQYGVIIGRLLARQLRANIGDKLTLTLPQVSITPAGVFPRSKRFTLVGVFEVGAQLDQGLAIIHLADGQKLFKLKDKVEGIRLKVDDIYQAESVLTQLRQQNPRLETTSWVESQGSLFQAIKMEKLLVSIMLLLIVAVAAFNVITSLVLMVSDKRSDIAVLRTMGMSAKQVMAVFIIQGISLGGLGILMGTGFGLAIAYWVADISQWLESLMGTPIFDPNVYFIKQLPSDIRANDIIWIVLASFLISFLATLYPAYRASQIEPAEALRYD